jgi:predicted RNase H-like HicB family nuclease
MSRYLTAIIEKEGSEYVSLCPELDIASQGDSIKEAKDNLKEALDLFFECASPEEIRTGTLLSIIRQSGIPRSEFEY